ncbi:MAG TPA: uridine kinase [Bacteriovoracaceae bacterium]|nr:uridine kinase [Bacteriovoracaceae bacterium]
MHKKQFLIGIAGGSGSGKTTFAQKIMKSINSSDTCLMHMDSYYLPEHPKDLYTSSGKANYDHPDAFDWQLLRKHLSDLKDGLSIKCPIYDFATSSRTGDFETVGPCKVILFEGIFSLYDQVIRGILDIKCFLHVDSDIRFTRRLHRDVKERGRSLESVIAQYYDTVRPMYQKYLDPQRQYADFTVGEETDVASLILSARIRELIGTPSVLKASEAV